MVLAPVADKAHDDPKNLIEFAKLRLDYKIFSITALGCGLAFVSALGGAVGWTWDQSQKTKQAQLEAEQGILEKKFEQLATENREHWTRQRAIVELGPHAVGLMQKRDCESDYAAVTLTDEIEDYEQGIHKSEASASSARDAHAIQRAILSSLRARLQANTGYCSCSAIDALNDYLESDNADNTATLRSELAVLLSEAAQKCSKPVQDEVRQVARAYGSSRYYVVLGNDLNCRGAQNGLAGIRRGMQTILGRAFDESQLTIKQGRFRGRYYFVSAYGGQLSLEVAEEKAGMARALPGMARDVYASAGVSFRDPPSCAKLGPDRGSSAAAPPPSVGESPPPPPPPPPPLPLKWTGWQVERCTDGRATMSARLEGIAGGVSWEAACAATQATPPGEGWPRVPNRCVKDLFATGIWGQFDTQQPCR